MAVGVAGDVLAGLRGRLAAFGGRTGLAVIAVGLLVIALGYNGIAGASINGIVDLRAQLPYLLSGGVFGLALVAVGAALLVVQSAREDRMHLQARLDELIDLLAATAAVAVPAPSDLAGLVAAGSSSFHAPDCRLVDGRDGVEYLTVEEAGDRGLRPCRICRPVQAQLPR